MSTQIDDGDLLQAEGREIGLDSGTELLGSLGGQPPALIVSRCSNLGHNDQRIGVGKERLPQELVGHVGSVELRGVDVVDPGVDGPAEYRQRDIPILGRPEDTGTGELHGAKAHAADGPTTQHDRFVRHAPRYTRKRPFTLSGSTPDPDGPPAPTVTICWPPGPGARASGPAPWPARRSKAQGLHRQPSDSAVSGVENWNTPSRWQVWGAASVSVCLAPSSGADRGRGAPQTACSSTNCE